MSVHGAASLFPRPRCRAHRQERGFGMATAGEHRSGAVGSRVASKPCSSTQNPRYGPAGYSGTCHPGGHSAPSSPRPHSLQGQVWVCFHSPLLQAQEGKRGAGRVSGSWEQNPRELCGGGGGGESGPLLTPWLLRALSQAGRLQGAVGSSEPPRDHASAIPEGLAEEDVTLINIAGASGKMPG